MSFFFIVAFAKRTLKMLTKTENVGYSVPHWFSLHYKKIHLFSKKNFLELGVSIYMF